ncbi:hypothetical protein HDF16_005341 [Granulicella aggregans]|uniref:YhcG N-terminal domain-containing protein n=1 Tax=Granulicella aggregans TaxID=474949 RepID=A0A7W8E7T3_9BACT|nr:hypothetical protein [Granulicella aggregans]
MELAERLTADFDNGFSRSNLEYMRRFHLTYPNRGREISQTVSGKSVEEERRAALSWSHHVFLLGLKEAAQRSFHEIEASEQG